MRAPIQSDGPSPRPRSVIVGCPSPRSRTICPVRGSARILASPPSPSSNDRSPARLRCAPWLRRTTVSNLCAHSQRHVNRSWASRQEYGAIAEAGAAAACVRATKIVPLIISALIEIRSAALVGGIRDIDFHCRQAVGRAHHRHLPGTQSRRRPSQRQRPCDQCQ